LKRAEKKKKKPWAAPFEYRGRKRARKKNPVINPEQLAGKRQEKKKKKTLVLTLGNAI
jgi:hypothetical protein